MPVIKHFFLTLLIAVLLSACGQESEPTASNNSQSTVPETPKAETAEISSEQSEPLAEPVMVPNSIEDNGVVYMEAIYAAWPKQEVVESKPATEDVQEDSEPKSEAPKPQAKTHTINAQARIFKPDIIYINPGDTVGWVNMTSHNTVSVEGLIPEGATPWQSKLGENLKLQLDVEGIYGYVCLPHIGFGMMGLIVVGQPDNLEAVRQTAMDTLKGPFRRLIGKLKKVNIPQ